MLNVNIAIVNQIKLAQGVNEVIYETFNLILVSSAKFTVEQVDLIKNPPVPNVEPDDFLSKKPRKLPRKIRKKGKRVTLRWANKFIQFRRYYERLERINDPKKPIRDISKAASQEWKKLKRSEPKIIEFFELMSLLDKEYQKFISLEKDEDIHTYNNYTVDTVQETQFFYSIEEAVQQFNRMESLQENQLYHNTPLFIDNNINIVDIENIINAENYMHNNINADINITNINTEFMMNQQPILNELPNFLYNGVNPITPDTNQLEDLIRFCEENQN
nr:4033_t:CDS:2 [Entrophospora candida]